MAAATLAGLLIQVLSRDVARAGTTGRLAGRVLDSSKKPLVGADISVPTARVGAVTDESGRYVILNLPAGTYDVRVRLLGYQPVVVQGVQISPDNTTTLDAALKEAPVEVKEIVVTAERPVVDVNLTSSVASVSRKEINSLPVQDVQDIVNLQAGVVDGHFRGGRLGEVQYQVDGVTVNNPYDNASTLHVDRYLLEEVQVISGTFDAEYGQAMSGVVNAVLRSGGEKFRWDAEGYGGGFLYNSDARTYVSSTQPVTAVLTGRAYGNESYSMSLSGPVPMPHSNFIVTARYANTGDYVEGVRRFLPTDSSNFETRVFYPTGDGASVPLGNVEELSGVGKIETRLGVPIKLGYQAIWNVGHEQRHDWAFRLDPDGESRQERFSIVHGLDWAHTLGKASFYNLSLRQNYFSYEDKRYDDVFDPRYDQAGPPKGHPDYELGAYVQGVDFTRFEQTTNSFVTKGAYEAQLTHVHHLKIGGEYQYSLLQFGTPGSLVFATLDGRQQLIRHVSAPPPPGTTAPWVIDPLVRVNEYRPVIVSGYGQDDVEWNDLRLRAGLRFDFFDARATVPSDPSNPANAIEGAPQSVPVATSNKLSLAPRLGVSFPVTKDAAVYFAYGHFYQMPALGTVFSNADYSVLDQLQAGGITYGVMGNPDIKPERTVQYQFGYKHAVTPWLGIDLCVFYKDIRDLLGVEFISTYNGAEYPRFTNVDFGSVTGFTISIDQRQVGWFRSTLDYTWQMAQGNSSDPRETATRAEAGEDPRPHLVPFTWDQRHTLNLSLEAVLPHAVSSTAVVRVASGQPYTPALTSGFSGGLETNSGRKPAAVLLDLQAWWQPPAMAFSPRLFGRVYNALDSRFFNGFVFTSSGSPYYSRYSAADLVTLNDPTRFYAPRRIEIGIGFGGGANP